MLKVILETTAKILTKKDTQRVSSKDDTQYIERLSRLCKVKEIVYGVR
jgi:hypothetical protein